MPRYLGQHFLKDNKILSRIVGAIQTMRTEHQGSLIEIGPGKGALTKRIYEISPDFFCLEKDITMQPHLLAFLDPEHIIRGDVLERDYADFDKTSHMVAGNLPYYITSPIFRKFFVDNNYTYGGVFLIQKEVAEKIRHDAHKKSYLWRLVNNHYTVEYLFIVKPKCFNPPPKVDSAVVKFTRKEKGEIEDTTDLLLFLDQVSSMKRKTLGAIQKKLAKKNRIISVPEDLAGKRLEELGREDMLNILS